MKTEKTLSLERAIRRATRKMGVFGCFEVTIGFFGKERVDYMTYDTKGIFRCYEMMLGSNKRSSTIQIWNISFMISAPIQIFTGVLARHCVLDE